jgi:hypothetical protein
MNSIHTTFHTLYQQDTQLPADHFPLHYIPTPIPDDPPTDFEVTCAVQKLRRFKAPGPSGIRAEHLQTWMRDRKDQTKWKNLITLIQQIFSTGNVPQCLAFSTLVLLPKPDGDTRGIGL